MKIIEKKDRWYYVEWSDAVLACEPLANRDALYGCRKPNHQIFISRSMSGATGPLFLRRYVGETGYYILATGANRDWKEKLGAEEVGPFPTRKAGLAAIRAIIAANS